MKQYTACHIRHEINTSSPSNLTAKEVENLVFEYCTRTQSEHVNDSRTFRTEEEARAFIDRQPIESYYTKGFGNLVFLDVSAYELWAEELDEDGEIEDSDMIARFYAPAKA